MRCTSSLRASLCRPHVHVANCRICEAASTNSNATRQGFPNVNNITNASTPAAPPSQATSAKPQAPGRAAEISVSAGGASLLARREADYSVWRRRYGPGAGLGTLRPTGSVPVVAAFLDRSTPFSADLLEEAVSCLDEHCRRDPANVAVPGPLAPCAALLAIPSVIRFGQPKRLAASLRSFAEAVSRLTPAQQEKQRLFQRALLDFQRVMKRQTRLRFFLACGTALAAHREGCFIVHDDDIDVGVFLHDLETLGRLERQGESRAGVAGASVLSQREAVQRGVARLLSDLCSDTPLFVPFDACGDVLKGLELRFLHRATNVKLDLNVYYPPLHPEDDALVSMSGPFCWHSSFYEQASERSFGMYRFKQSPFEADLTRVDFCDPAEPRGAGDTGFLVPPTLYLDEYFGRDWHTPRAFSYADGLAHEYKNIISE